MNSRLRTFKLVTTVLLVAWLLLLLSLVVYRQVQRRGVVSEAPGGGVATPVTEQPVRVQKGFVFTYALGVAPSFRLAASESVEFASGWLELKHVDITFFQEGQVAYGLLAQRARLNPAKNEALVEGEPQLSLGHGVVARAASFTVAGADRKLVSGGPVSFAGPGWGGLAGQLTSSLTEGILSLEQGVSLVAQEEGQPPITLLAPVATYHRKEGFMTFPQGLSLLRGQLTLQASSGKVEFDEAGRAIQRIALQGSVALTGFTESGEEVVGSFGDALAEKREPDRFWFTAEAAPTTGWVSLRVARPGQVQELKSWRLVGEGSAKGLQWFEGQGLACAASWTGVEEPSSLQATTLRVTFREGQPAQALAQGQVALQQGSARAWGEVLTAQLPTGPGELANPKGPVRFATEGLQGTCGRLVVNADGSFAAFGGVQGGWQSGGEAGKGSRFAARQASGHLRQGSVTLMQEARVWEENRVLQAEQIHVERSRELVTASGQVLSQASAPGEGTTTIQAQELSYQRLKGEAVYWGGVKVQDQRGNLASESLTVQLSTKGELLWGDFQGQVLIEDTAGRTLRGEAASYDFASEKLVVTGLPAVLEEASGNRVEAKRVEWYRKTGNLEVKGDVESPSQTVYHPQKPATPPARRTPSPRE